MRNVSVNNCELFNVLEVDVKKRWSNFAWALSANICTYQLFYIIYLLIFLFIYLLMFPSPRFKFQNHNLCDMIWYDMIWYDMIWYDMIWYDMIWSIWCDVMWCDVMSWCDVMWFLWYNKILHLELSCLLVSTWAMKWYQAHDMQ